MHQLTCTYGVVQVRLLTWGRNFTLFLSLEDLTLALRDSFGSLEVGSTCWYCEILVEVNIRLIHRLGSLLRDILVYLLSAFPYPTFIGVHDPAQLASIGK